MSQSGSPQPWRGEAVNPMPTDTFELACAPPDEDWAVPRSALLDVRELEALLLNMDASLNVHARAQFFGWTQGLLQSLVPHKALLCVLRLDKPLAYRVDAFSTVADPTALADCFRHEPSAVPALGKIWKQQNLRPVICEVSEVPAPLGGPLSREAARLGATRLALYGIPDVAGEPSSLFMFACEPHQPGANGQYILQLIVPFLHAAWVRCQPREGARGDSPAVVPAGVLSLREREVLRWIYLGKSNAEIGEILKISPLTVKNHVQKILRKLKVVNRAQAVGKALDARIIEP
jgi:transcriptional regulator EpsA